MYFQTVPAIIGKFDANQQKRAGICYFGTVLYKERVRQPNQAFAQQIKAAAAIPAPPGAVLLFIRG